MVRPKTKKKLKDLIESEIKKHGNQCDLNHIDVSLITSFSWLFSDFGFNGDISGWDVSGVTDMYAMFAATKFNGDISRWDVSGVESMVSMFESSEFNGDVSKWNRLSIIDDRDMFLGSNFAKRVCIKNPSFGQVKSHLLSLKLEADLKGSSGRNMPSKVRL